MVHFPLKALLIPDSWKNISETELLFLANDVDNSVLLNGKYFGRVFGPLIEEALALGYSSQILSQPWGWMKKREYVFPAHSMNRAFFIAVCLDRICTFLNIRSTFEKKLFTRILNLAKPKAIFCMNFHAAISEAGRRIGIPVIEVLHGTGYTKIYKGVLGPADKQLPSHIIASDSVSANTFSQLPNVEIFQMAPLWSRYKVVPQDELFDNEVPLISENNKPISVLFSLQWGFDGDEASHTEYKGILPNGLIPEGVFDAMKQTQNSAIWKFRLHPGQLRNPDYSGTRRRLGKMLENYPNASWYKPSHQSIPEVLSTTTHHISMDSMLSYEAASFGIPTLLLSPLLGHNSENSLFSDLSDAGYVTFGSGLPEEITNWLLTTNKLNAWHPDEHNVKTFSEILSTILEKNK